MKRGLFVNSSKANCSIYEAGVMIYHAIRYNQAGFFLDYQEINRERVNSTHIYPGYDFYIFNWHYWSLPYPLQSIERLHGKKVSIILEVGTGDKFPYLRPDQPYALTSGFDAYMVIDPTKTRQGNAYPFPRPLELVGDLPPLLSESRIVLGSFGLLTGGKRFEEIIENANRIGNCTVRINLPPVTYMGDIGICVRLQVYRKKLEMLADRGVDVIVTHDYMLKPALIRWCAQNTINVFPYHRDQPGLAAVTDQAISAGRPIAITNNSAFRHMLPYIATYPEQSYLELIETTPPGISRMQNDWHPRMFSERFREMMVEIGAL